MFLAHAAMDGSSKLSNTERKLLKSHKDNKNSSIDDNHNKRVMHRHVERQRRQEMASLCTSLRNLLPLEYIKGKRSASDHMHEAVNYIKDVEKKIKELGVKRDELKQLTNSSLVGFYSENPSAPSCVMVRSCLVGVEVVISSGLEEQVLHLSKVLEVLLKEGFNVLSCFSTKVNATLIHTIQSEASNWTSIDMSGLQNKLIGSVIPSLIENSK